MKRIAFHWSWSTSILLMFAVLSASCQRIGEYAEKRADHAAYGNIQGAQLHGVGESEAFTIDDEEGRRMREILEQEALAEQATMLTLSDTLAIAMANSRAYQSEKENLFIQALLLTETQKDFRWDTSASTLTASTSLTDDGSGTENFGDNGVDITHSHVPVSRVSSTVVLTSSDIISKLT